MSNNSKNLSCLNCGTSLVQGAEYCSTCGQSKHLGKLSFWQLVKDLVGNIVNLDNKIWQTLSNSFIPGKLTSAFVSGQRISYVNPARLFLFSLIVFIGSLAYFFNSIINTIPADDTIRSSERVNLASKYDSVAPVIVMDSIVLDTLKKSLFGESESERSNIKIGNVSILTGVLEDFDISKEDIAKLDANYLIDKYKILGFWNKLRIRQVIKIYKDASGVLKYFIGNLFWAIIFMTLCVAIFMKLLYIRQHIYLTEHLVFNTYTNAFNMLLSGVIIFIVSIILKVQSPSNEIDSDYIPYLNYLLFPASLYAFIALKNYYRQGWVKTFIKFILISIGYLFFMTAGLLLALLISLFLF